MGTTQKRCFEVKSRLRQKKTTFQKINNTKNEKNKT